MVAIYLFVVACCLAFASVALSVVMPHVHPYFRAYGANPEYKPALVVLVFAAAAKLIGV